MKKARQELRYNGLCPITGSLTKRIISVFIVFAMVLSLVPVTAVAEPTATPTTRTLPNFIAPIEIITDKSGWIAISDRAGLEAIADNLSGNYYLTADIDLSDGEWIPIGTEGNDGDGFTGTFDGQGYVIRNMSIKGEYRCAVGLFSRIWYGTVKNVGLEDTNIDEPDAVIAGGVVGSVYNGTISNVYSTGNIAIRNSAGDYYTNINVGGIAGFVFNETIITDCYNTAALSLFAHKNSLSRIGGIVGFAEYSNLTITNCFNSGNISGSADEFGGIIGKFDEGGVLTIERCYNSGKITAENERSLGGGIIGEMDWGKGYISDCYNIGDVSAYWASGIIGCVDDGVVELLNCYNTGKIVGFAEYEWSYSLGIGSLSNYLTNCYWYINSAEGGIRHTQDPTTPLTTAQMQQQASFVGFDFDNTWTFIDGVNDGLPVLRVFERFYAVDETTQTYPTPEGYSDNDYQKLVAFALQEDNLAELDWNLSEPGSWEFIRWNGEQPQNRQVSMINLMRNQSCCCRADDWDVPVDIIGKLDLSGFQSLEHMGVLGNITELDVSDCTKLKRLICSDNQLTVLDLSSNIALEELYCFHNNLKSIDLSNNSELITFYANNNQITDISSLQNLQKLRFVNVQSNFLDLSAPATQSAIEKIQATVDKNTTLRGHFSYTPQRTPPTLTRTLPNFIAPIEVIADKSGWIAVSDRAGLEAIADNLSGKYYLTADIDLSDGGWKPLGEYNNGFTGIFDGQGYVIRNIKISNSQYSAGLFGYVNNAIIRNVGLEDTNIWLTDGLSVYVGGIVGIAGNGSLISNCYNTGRVTADSDFWVGGISGVIHKSTITDCYNTSNVINIQNTAGGISGGTGGESKIYNCFNTGNVISESGGEAGGISGSIGGAIISNCFNSGEIQASANMGSRAGGIVGVAESDSFEFIITDCYNIGIVSARSEQRLDDDDGILGNIRNIYSDIVINCYSYINGVGTISDKTFTTAQMQQQSSFVGFDFDNTWTFIDGVNGGLPVLRVFERMYTPVPPTHRTLPNFIAPIEVIADKSGWTAVSDRAGLEAIEDNLSGKYYLTNDIDLSGKEWAPLGSVNAPFTGTFDGQGYVVRSMTITGSLPPEASRIGFFAAVSNAVIRNVGLEDTNINVSRGRYAGGLIGTAQSTTVSNCYNTGSVRAVTVSAMGVNIAGGIVASDSGGTIINTYNTAYVGMRNGLGGTAGGIVARTDGSNPNAVFTRITNCFNTGGISAESTGQNPAQAGGIVGSAGNTDITSCFNTGTIFARIADTEDNRPRGGGIVGSSWSGNSEINITDSYNNNSPNSVFRALSGIAGTRQNITRSYCAGRITDNSFSGFDFGNTWKIINGVNGGLPVLRVFERFYVFDNPTPDIPPVTTTTPPITTTEPPTTTTAPPPNTTQPPTTTTPPNTSPPTDVTIKDALEILKYLAKLPSVFDGTGIRLDIGDALEILKHLAKLPSHINPRTIIREEAPRVTATPTSISIRREVSENGAIAINRCDERETRCRTCRRGRVLNEGDVLVCLRYSWIKRTPENPHGTYLSRTGLEQLIKDGVIPKNVTHLSLHHSFSHIQLGLSQSLNLALLAEFTDLVWLDLEHNFITDISPLAGLTKLQRLDLDYNWNLSDISPLAGMVDMVELDINDTSVTDLSPLVNMSKLEKLDLKRNPVTDLSPISGLTSLKKINLSNTHVVNLSPLAGLTGLEWLELQRDPLDGVTPRITDISALSGLTKLTYLNLRGNRIVDPTPLKNLTSLNAAYIHNNNTTTNGHTHTTFNVPLLREVLATTPPIRINGDITLRDYCMSADCGKLWVLCGCDHYGEGVCNSCGEACGFIVFALDKHCAELTRLNLTLRSTVPPNVRNEHLVPLARMQKLTQLTVGGRWISDISPIAEIKTLQVFTISSRTAITEEDLVPFTKLPSLTNLNLTGHTQFNNTARERIRAMFPGVEVRF
jgi:Leucine-rich repeat (LRR) protein